MGILTFGQSAFFASRSAYSAGLFFTHSEISAPASRRLAAAGEGRLACHRDGGDRRMAAFWHGVSELYASVITLCCDRLHATALFRRSDYRFEQRTVRLREHRSFRGSLVLDSGHAAGDPDRAAWVFVSSDAGQVLVAIRENDSVPISRPGHAPAEDPRSWRVRSSAPSRVTFSRAIRWWSHRNWPGSYSAPNCHLHRVGGRATLIGPVLATIAVD
jgi:hypothetical protein